MRRQRRVRAAPPDVPAWVGPFVEDGALPPRWSGAFEQFIGWYFFGESVPGLPAYDTDEGSEIASRIVWPD